MDDLLQDSTDNTLSLIDININNTVENIDITFENAAYYIKRRIDEGADNPQISQILTDITNWMASSGKLHIFKTGIYGFIRGEYFSASDWIPPDDYVPQSRPWFIEAQKAKGEIAIIPPYIDAMTNEWIIGCSKEIFDTDSNSVGVISIDAFLSNIFSYTENTSFEHNGYIIILDGELRVLVHKNDSYIGKHITEVNSNAQRLIDNIKKRDTTAFSQKIFLTDNRTGMIISIKKAQNGWYILSVVSMNAFYSKVYKIAFILALIGLIGFLITAHFLHEFYKQKKIAEEANVGKSVFLARMSHELRTPLNAIKGFAEIELRKNHGADTKNNISRIFSSGTTLLRIINDILDISKIESGKIEIVKTEYDTATLINDVINMNYFNLEERSIEFDVEIGENIPAKFFGDETRIKQVANNILSNAIKYTTKGKISISFLVNYTGDKNCEFIVDVKDTGIGISKENLKKLFFEYARFDVEKHKEVKGTGLGLSVTKKLVELMDGEIVVESEYGVGSNFKVTINQSFIGDSVISKETIKELKSFNSSKSEISKSGMGIIKEINFVSLPDANVLLVDDAQVNLDVATGMMAPYEMNIDTLLSGEEALKLLAGGCEKYDILFVDHMMPVMDGIECVSKIRALNSRYAKNVPTIALTANAIVGVEEIFLKSGFNGYISKPIDAVKLNEIIRKFLCSNENFAEKSKLSAKKSAKNEINFEKIDGINFEEGIKKFNGNFDIYVGILKSFVENIPEKIADVSQPSADNLSNYGITVHGIKGSCYGIGATNLGDKANILEKLAKENDLDKILNLNSQFIESANKLISDLKQFIENNAAQKKTLKKLEKPDAKLLKALKISAENYDIEEMQKIVKELESFDYENGAELIEKISSAAVSFDYQTIIDVLSD
jgi:signal transduction histidine kinase/DNA-binding NarL/FixJ family response regulator